MKKNQVGKNQQGKSKEQGIERGVQQAIEQGIALPMVLVVLMFSATLAFGTMYLSNNNLRIAGNIQNHTIAKYNAEAGLEASYIVLKDIYEQTGELPTEIDPDNFSTLAISGTETEFKYAIDPSTYAVDATGVYFSVIGRSNEKANYTTEMRVSTVGNGTGATSNFLPIYSHGLISKQAVVLNKMGQTTLVDSSVHGNKGFTVNGSLDNIMSCIERNDQGLCIDTTNSNNVSSRFTAASDQGGYTCNQPWGSGLCTSGQPTHMGDDPFNPWTSGGAVKDPAPAIISPKAALLKGLVAKGLVSANELKDLGYLDNDAATDPVSLRDLADMNGDGAVNFDSNYGPVDGDLDLTAIIDYICSGSGVNTYSGSPLNNPSDLVNAGFTQHKTICITNGINFPPGSNLKNMNVIVKNGGMNFNGSIDLDNTVLVNSKSGINLNSGNINNALVYSKQQTNVNANATIEGVTSFLSDSSFIHDGSNVVAKNESGESIVGLNVMAKNQLIFNGSTDTYGVFQTRGAFFQNGDSSLFGSVIAENNLTFNDGIIVDSSMPVENPTLETVTLTAEAATGGFSILGRR